MVNIEFEHFVPNRIHGAEEFAHSQIAKRICTTWGGGW